MPQAAFHSTAAARHVHQPLDVRVNDAQPVDTPFASLLDNAPAPQTQVATPQPQAPKSVPHSRQGQQASEANPAPASDAKTSNTAPATGTTADGPKVVVAATVAAVTPPATTDDSTATSTDAGKADAATAQASPVAAVVAAIVAPVPLAPVAIVATAEINAAVAATAQAASKSSGTIAATAPDVTATVAAAAANGPRVAGQKTQATTQGTATATTGDASPATGTDTDADTDTDTDTDTTTVPAPAANNPAETAQHIAARINGAHTDDTAHTHEPAVPTDRTTDDQRPSFHIDGLTQITADATQGAAGNAGAAASAVSGTQSVSASSATPASAAATGAAVSIAALPVEIASRAIQGKNSFEIRLDPPELGRIEVRLDVDRGGNVTSRITADRSDTLDLLRRDAPQLERALQDAGLKTGDNAMQFSLRDQNAGSQSAFARPDAPARSSQVAVSDTTTAATADVSQTNSWRASVRGGVDIRV